MKKIIATVLAAVLAVGTISLPASAASDDNKPKVTGLGILPALAGPAIIAGTVSGPSLHAWTAHQYFKFYKWDWAGWKKVYHLKTHGWDVYKKVHGYKVKVYAKKDKIASSGDSSKGAYIVGCIMGSALGAITAAIRKGNALGNPLRWRSQAEHEMIVKSGVEKKFELTNEEAQTALAFCGLGSFALHWQQQPAVVRAGY
jgi:hypothetical protein